MPTILATWEAEFGRIMIRNQSRKKVEQITGYGCVNLIPYYLKG
jgi:hypothetical protein